MNTKLSQLSIVLAIATVAAACTSRPRVGEATSELLGEVENFPCTGGSFPCLDQTDTVTFNTRLPFCFATTANYHLASNVVNACQVGEEDSAVGCRYTCGDLGPVFTSGCAYQFNYDTQEYVGRCFSSYVP